MEITVGSRVIGPNEPVFVIAEVGSNFDSFEQAKDSIRLAKNCGADAVKFQLFSHKALYGFDGPVLPGSIHHGWLGGLKQKADAAGIELELVDVVDPFVNVHKVASSELTHLRLLERIKAKGKPVFLSTGASGIADVNLAIKILDGVPVVSVFCVSAYPARRVDLKKMEDRKVFTDPATNAKKDVLVGYSDHTVDVTNVPKSAKDRGAVVIEKHVNFFDVKDSPDAPHSLDRYDFKSFVDVLRGTPVSGGGPDEERNAKLFSNRRLIAMKDIQKGELMLEGENYGAFRSLKEDTRGLSPWVLLKRPPHTAKKFIAKGDAIGPGDY
jgi:N-acetylneuraminate synthase